MHSPADIFAHLASQHASDPWPSIDERLSWLTSLRDGMLSHRDKIQEAVWNDFRKSSAEADLTESLPVLLELKVARRNLRSWAASRRLRNTFPLWGITSRLRYRPKGVALIISPWNYPFNLSLGPLVSSLAAGNRTVIKPSERVPNSSRLIAEIVAHSLPTGVAHVVEGGPETGKELLGLPFDHFFFTGGNTVGRLVMQAAAEHFSTATLELGGKSPAIIDGTLDPQTCAEKVVRGKFLNGGQTCIAPDYVVVHHDHFNRFVDAALEASARLENELDMAAPVDADHAARLDSMLTAATGEGALIHRSETTDHGLTLVTGVRLSSRLMQQEIFGPILPVLRYRTLDELVAIIEKNPSPLTTYVFSKEDDFAETVARRIQTGTMSINETLLHFVHPRIPFGGVRRSGSGRSHGRWGFLAFSNPLPTMRQNFRKGIVALLYPPRGKLQRRLRDMLFRIFGR
jgi:aldehyde dehydrogenase (NAD+)